MRRPIELEEDFEEENIDSGEDKPPEFISSVPDPEDEEKEFKIECEDYDDEETNQEATNE